VNRRQKARPPVEQRIEWLRRQSQLAPLQHRLAAPPRRPRRRGARRAPCICHLTAPAPYACVGRGRSEASGRRASPATARQITSARRPSCLKL
jgi:hypothetical protein